ncbi:diacylglycerol kinase family protein [Gordonia sp. SCSIO 19800]|uniref:diacylglycerol/lipid kinase family protein n=1 Tax=Gordonia sp. SCSIO 19800 TaxID=2826926 RepID=UPI001B83C067|nr:diacylglycerol kinase family protein [Gordonia sp. SCSIO 19800]MBR7190683.1 NAD(+)/NADH kinase [Gordonia sp. SCSIO 19800]
MSQASVAAEVAPPTTRRWWARAAMALAVAAILLPVAAAGLLRLLGLLAICGVCAVVIVAAVYWFLISRGVLRIVSAALAVLPVAVLVVFLLRERQLWVVIAAALLAAAAVGCGRRALRPSRIDSLMPEHPAPDVHRPFIIMNPRSGGGKVVRFDLQRKAESLGAEVVLLDGPVEIDVEQLARDAVARGADLLGVAGGDGTQALVAGVAAEAGVPFLVISAGTRNHFALDLGLDRQDPARCLDALRDGVEFHVDLCHINGRPFVNNASFGIYAEVVQSPQYRDDKTRTVLRMLPDLLGRGTRSGLRAVIGSETVADPQAVLVSNGPYATNDVAGLGRRTRIDEGRLGVVTVSVSDTRQAVGLLRRTHDRGLVQRIATEVTVDADAEVIPVGVDGESLQLTTPVLCTITPGALRVRVPRHRPETRIAPPQLDWLQLWYLAWNPHRAS